jgi:hypothetical protein
VRGDLGLENKPLKLETSVTIKRAVDDVYSFVADPLNGGKWNSAVVDVRKLPGGPEGVGASYVMRRQLPSGLVENTLEVVEYVKDSKLTIRTTSGPTPFVYHYGFEPDGSGTRLSLRAEGDLGEIGHEIGGVASIAPGFLLAGLIKRGLDANLHTLKGILEG